MMDLDLLYDLMMFFDEADDDISSIHYEAIPLDYAMDDILKTCLELHDAELIHGIEEKYIDGNIDFFYQSLSHEGKQLIKQLQDDDLWQNIKDTMALLPPSAIVLKMVAHSLDDSE